MRRKISTPRWSGFLGALLFGVLCFPALSSAATVTYASNKVMGPTNGLVGYWTFNGADISGTTVLDRSGLGNNGTLTNMATKTSPVAGKLGQGLRFVGATTDRINAGSAASLDDITTLTVAFWVKRHSVWGYSTMVSKGSWQGNGWALTSSGYNSTIAFLRDFSGSDGMWESTGIPTFRKDAWTHVTLTYNKTSVSNTPLIYVNGVRVAVSTTTAPTGSANPETSYSLFVGADGGGVMGSFPGTLDDVRIYNRILSATEVKQLYKEGQVTVTSFTCGVSTVKDVDGNVYNTVKIGTQCWMKQNMRVGTRINVAGNQSNNSIIEKYCYADTASNCTTNHPNQPDGGLYQWNEAMQYSSTPGAQGICPAGWHIPTHDQFTTLERSVCTSGSCATDFPYDITTTGYRGTTEGTNLKPNGTSLFEGNLAGDSFGGSFYNRGAGGLFWSSLGSGGSAWYRYLSSGGAQVYRNQVDQSFGLSVRCLKN